MSNEQKTNFAESTMTNFVGQGIDFNVPPESSVIVAYLLNNKIDWNRPMSMLNNRIMKIIRVVMDDLVVMSKRDSPMPPNEVNLMYNSWVNYSRSKLGQ